MEPIRTLHVFGSLNMGGAETMLMSIYRKIDRTKIQFDFVKHTNEECAYDAEILELGGKIYAAPKYKIVNHKSYIDWWKNFFKTHKEYNIIHCHLYTIASIILPNAKKMGLTTVAHSHSTSHGKGFKSSIQYFYTHALRVKADYNFACSKEAGVWLYGKNKEFKVINNAIDFNDYQFDDKIRTEKRQEFQIKDDELLLGHVGRMNWVKNHTFLLDLFFEVKKRLPKSKLLLVGAGDLWDDIKQKINELQLNGSVIMAGVRKDVPKLLQAMDIFALPSHYEGLGLVLIEAQASGLCSVIADSIPNEVILDKDLIVKQKNFDKVAWAEKILSIKCDRKKDNNYLKDKGYDINESVKFFEEFYTNNQNKNEDIV